MRREVNYMFPRWMAKPPDFTAAEMVNLFYKAAGVVGA
jgi:hypothetical protein